MHTHQIMTRLYENSSAASIPEAEIRVSELDSNGVLTSKPLKKVEDITKGKTNTTNELQAQVWNLTRHEPVLESKGYFYSIYQYSKRDS